MVIKNIELKSWLWIISIFILPFIALSVPFYLKDLLINYPTIYLFVLSLYILYLIFSILFFFGLLKFKSEKTSKIIDRITFFGTTPIYLAVFSKSYFSVITRLAAYAFLSILIPNTLCLLIIWIFNINLELEAAVYVFTTITMFSIILLNNIVKNILNKFKYEKRIMRIDEEVYKFNDLSDYFLSDKNIKFLIYGFYCIMLLVFNYYKFQSSSFFRDNNFDQSIIQSFATFLAFDKFIGFKKDVTFKASDMMRKMLKTVEESVKERENKA